MEKWVFERDTRGQSRVLLGTLTLINASEVSEIQLFVQLGCQPPEAMHSA